VVGVIAFDLGVGGEGRGAILRARRRAGQAAGALVERLDREILVVGGLAGADRLREQRLGASTLALLPDRLRAVIGRAAGQRGREIRRVERGREGGLGGVVAILIEEDHAAPDPIARGLRGGGDRCGIGGVRVCDGGQAGLRAIDPAIGRGAAPERAVADGRVGVAVERFLRLGARKEGLAVARAGRETLRVGARGGLGFRPAVRGTEGVNRDQVGFCFGDGAGRDLRGPSERARDIATTEVAAGGVVRVVWRQRGPTAEEIFEERLGLRPVAGVGVGEREQIRRGRAFGRDPRQLHQRG
jgi:hypothetical protein